MDLGNLKKIRKRTKASSLMAKTKEAMVVEEATAVAARVATEEVVEEATEVAEVELKIGTATIADSTIDNQKMTDLLLKN